MRAARATFGFALLLLTLLADGASAQGVTLPDFQRVTLDNGTVLILSEKPDVPLVSVSAILRGGAVADPENLSGLASLFASLLEKGAGGRDAAQFAEAVDSVGGRLSASADIENITISGDFLARDGGLMLELLADMLLRPALDAEEMDRLRGRAVNFIRAAKDTNLNALLPIYGQAFLFGDHPYGNPASGSETTLENISHKDVLEFYEQQVGGDRLIISVSGDIDVAAVAAALTGAFSGWRKAGGAVPEVPAAKRRIGRRVLLIDKPGATQTYFWIANVGVARDYENRAALDLANTVFGGRFTSMLNTELRIKSGLTYGAQSQLTRRTQPGSLAIVSFTRTDATVEAIDMALGVLEQLRASAIDDDMLVSAQNYILGQFPTALETAAQLGAQLAALEAYGLGTSYINDYGASIMAADSDMVAAIIEQVYPAPDDLVFVLLGDAELIREAVGKYGPLTEMSITEPRFRP